jgi:hypothetical protein
MIEPESVLPTPAPVTIQTSLMTSREIVICGENTDEITEWGEDAALAVA